MDQPTFNLPTLVRAVADELDTPDPHLIAAEVLTRIDPDDLATALALCLPDYVRKTLRVSPENAPPSVVAPTGTASTYASSDGLQFVSSRERDRYEAQWQRELGARHDIGVDADGKHQWKFLGDCTHGDLLRLVEHRRHEAEANNAAADRFERLARLLEQTGAPTVSALSITDLDSAA